MMSVEGKQMIPRIYVSLRIFEPNVTEDDVSWFRSINASKCWLQGESRFGIQMAYEHNGCDFSIDYQDSYYVEEVAMTFLKKLISAKPGLFPYIREHNFDPMLSVSAYASDVIPSISFDACDIKLLAEHNISLDVDVILTAG